MRKLKQVITSGCVESPSRKICTFCTILEELWRSTGWPSGLHIVSDHRTSRPPLSANDGFDNRINKRTPADQSREISHYGTEAKSQRSRSRWIRPPLKVPAKGSEVKQEIIPADLSLSLENLHNIRFTCGAFSLLVAIPGTRQH